MSHGSSARAPADFRRPSDHRHRSRLSWDAPNGVLDRSLDTPVRALQAVLVLGVFGLRRLLGGDTVAAAEPAMQVDIGAALRAERLIGDLRRLAADRAARRLAIGKSRDLGHASPNSADVE